ncbi:MAG: alanine racemase [Candidatus Omnitrophota bacterium]
MTTAVETRPRSAHSVWIEIHRDRLIENLALLRAASPAALHTIAVVKANAYGHGLHECARPLSGLVDFLGVSSIREAEVLRQEGFSSSIFLFGRFFGQELIRALELGATLSVSSFDEARAIAVAAEAFTFRPRIHIKVDTGMGRMGLPLRDAHPEILRISKLPNLQCEGIYSHFPTAEAQDGFAERQLQNLALLIARLETEGIRFKYRHIANSAGILRTESPAFNTIRPGLMLYGIDPGSGMKHSLGARPVLALKSRIAFVKPLEAGETSGYGRTFIAEKPCHLGILPIGYSHGYPVSASNRAFVLYHGKKYPVVGRVSMDYLAVDFGALLPEAGDTVTLIGEDGPEAITAEDLAVWAGTIPYEIVTRLSPFLPRLVR